MFYWHANLNVNYQTEDQQAIEDEGIIIPMKPNMPNVPMNNPYSRNQSFFHTNTQNPQAFNRVLPIFSSNLSNAQGPLAMMNYFNQHNGLNLEHDNSFITHQPAPQKQQIPIDLVRLMILFHISRTHTHG